MPEELLVDEEAKPPDQESSSLCHLAQTRELDHLPEKPPACLTRPFFRRVVQIAHSTRDRRLNHLIISDGADIFRKRFFPNTSRDEWNTWQWQQSHSYRDLNNLVKVMRLSPGETSLGVEKPLPFPLSITPYYASLLAAQDADKALRRSVIPNQAESRIFHTLSNGTHCMRMVTAPCPVLCTVIRTGFCFWSPRVASLTAGTASARGWWAHQQERPRSDRLFWNGQ